PGIGNLTEAILKTGARVVAIEQDADFVRFLRRRFGDRISVIQADAVKAFLPKFNKVVSNLPYQISSPITFKLLEEGFEVAVLMLQLEFAERMVAKPGTSEYSRLSVGIYYRAACEILHKVPPHAFWPQPKVDSCIVRLVPKPAPFQVRDKEMFAKVTQAIFSHRRKKIQNSLKVDPAVSGLIEADVEKGLGLLPYSDRRPEELTPEMIGELSDAFLELVSSSRSISQ
ncbi:MAG TPA: 16S rRNA (adenine(1518)-N(6)/adenine(1519)-N(6))-dimethyltransferase RsmA, partial [Thermoplasmata archaeon]|nr:16S rRNA (adenine(1518)-N(6)/adenine(1519)-N(6))-dimethyltransferase RsmA [Thermoplasmata archaeon]